MTNALKGALLSALVFPGLGQVVLKHYRRGLFLMLAFSAGLFAILAQAVHQALTILEKIQAEGGLVDFNAISKAADQAAAPSDDLIFYLLLAWVLGCWVFATIDAWRIGRRKDIDNRAGTPASSETGRRDT